MANEVKERERSNSRNNVEKRRSRLSVGLQPKKTTLSPSYKVPIKNKH